MVVHAFGETEPFSYQPASALPQGAIKSLNISRQATIFACCEVSFRVKYGLVSLPIIGKEAHLLMEKCRYRDAFPEFLRIFFGSLAHMHANDLPLGRVEGQPNPSFVLLLHRSPYLIQAPPPTTL